MECHWYNGKSFKKKSEGEKLETQESGYRYLSEKIIIFQ